MIPQIIILFLFAANLGMALALHGQPRHKQTYDFWETFIGFIIVVSLLYWGGFFDPLLGG